MQVRVLGARQGESRDTHFGSLVVDGAIALDAGSLTGGLTLEEQLRLRAVVVAHRHFDHMKDLATLGFNLFGRNRQLDVFCPDEVRSALETTLLNPLIWIDFFREPLASPTYRHVAVAPGASYDLPGARMRMIAVPHSVPTLGVELASVDGKCLLYTSDNGPGAAAAWAESRPDLLVTEATYPSAQASAAEHGHLTAALLAAELTAFRAAVGYLPRVLVVHLNPFHSDAIAAEIAGIARDLGAEILVADEGATYEV